MRPIFTALAGSALLALSMVASAQSFSHDGRPERIFQPKTGLNSTDGGFMRQAAYINMMELELASIAQQRGTSDFVKEYAKEMAANHNQDRAQLQQIATNKGFTLPTDLPAEMQRSINYMSRLSGGDFDAAYRHLMVDGHQNAAGTFQREVANGHDEDVKAYAVIILPELVLSGHLAQAEKTLMGSTKADHGM
jgi:putative membrane protein